MCFFELFFLFRDDRFIGAGSLNANAVLARKGGETKEKVRARGRDRGDAQGPRGGAGGTVINRGTVRSGKGIRSRLGRHRRARVY